jgi:hypothetical protein
MPDKVKFHYIKSRYFRTIHVDGAVGGLTPTLDVFVTMYSQRSPIPLVTVQPILPTGQLGQEIIPERVSKDGLVREAEVGIFMNLVTAKALHQWLTEQISQADEMQKKIQAPHSDK